MYLFFKRCADFLVALVLLLLLSIILIPLAILLRLTAEGNVFYRQERIGLKNNPFHILKFATMLANSMNMGLGATTVRNDPRITPVGKYLRISKINELPQIINVLKGEMSIVGARPLPLKSFNKYSEKVRAKIYQTRPGITGIGSVIFRDEELLATTVKDLGFEPIDYYRKHIYPYKGAVELWYQKNISFLVDLKIIFLTAWLIIFPKSQIVYQTFKDLPKRPDTLTVKGIHKLYEPQKNN